MADDLQDLQDLHDLQDGWDGPDTFAPVSKLVDFAHRLTLHMELGRPKMFPGQSGEISLLWEKRHITLMLSLDDGVLYHHTSERVVSFEFEHQQDVDEVVAVITKFAEAH